MQCARRVSRLSRAPISACREFSPARVRIFARLVEQKLSLPILSSMALALARLCVLNILKHNRLTFPHSSVAEMS
eukprot:6212655-Pleurochrysis_carterae.AAC.2